MPERIPSSEGARAARRWLDDLGLRAAGNGWYVDIMLDVVDRPASQTYSAELDTRFTLSVYSVEWSYFFCYGRRASWIRVIDGPIVHGRDDFSLCDASPQLANIGAFLLALERRYAAPFAHEHALIRTNVPNAVPAVQAWLGRLIP